MGILLAKQPVMLRAIVLKNKPPEMLEASPKGEVPTLVFDDGKVIDQSLDVMVWALEQSDPNKLFYPDDPSAKGQILELITTFEADFVPTMKQYKCAARYHDEAEEKVRQQCEHHLSQLEQRLTEHAYLFGATPSLVDYALLPFIRQFARVDKKWFVKAPYPKLRSWLNAHLQCPLFSKTMKNHPLWLDCGEAFLIGK